MSVIFGAKAKIFLKSIDDMEILSKKISKGLMLKDFTLDFDKYPPYALIGSGEALGFDLWLNKTTEIEGYDYEFEIRTTLSHDEIMNDRMYDLSLWLGRFISEMCGVDTCVPNDGADAVFFNTES